MTAQQPVSTAARQLPLRWDQAHAEVYAAGLAAAPAPIDTPLDQCDGLTLAEPLVTLTDLPAFRTSSIDGWALRGPGPWRVTGRVLAGQTPDPLTTSGTCVEIATGAMVPDGTEAILRTEESTVSRSAAGSLPAEPSRAEPSPAEVAPEGVTVTGRPRTSPEWREPGEEASRAEELLPAGTPVTPGLIGLAASCGYETLPVRVRPTAALLVFGDELLVAGPPGGGRVRDALGPSVPAWLRRFGADTVHVDGPVRDTLDAHIGAIEEAVAAGAQLICTTGGTMHGPVDHLHPALSALGARYVVNTVAVRPGFPMLVAQLPGGQFIAGLPGNPQSAVVALVSLVAPLIAGLTGRPAPATRPVTLGAEIRGRGDYTHLALVRTDPVDGLARPVPHVGSAMLRGLAQSAGFAVIPPGGHGQAGDVVDLVPLPLLAGELR